MERVHRIQPQPVDVHLPEPHQRVVDHVPADLGLVERDRRSPRVVAALAAVQVRPERREVVAARAEVVVHDVLDDGEALRVRGVHEALVGRRTAVAVVHREPQHAVVPPAVLAVEGVDGEELHGVHPELDQVVEAPDGSVERALGGERAEVQLVQHAPRELAPSPPLVLPLVGRRIEHAGRLVHAVRLPPRSRVR